MAVAVADFRSAAPAAVKLERADGLALQLEPTPDVLAAIAAARRPGQVLVGFAAETDDGIERARQKRERKGVDLVVVNDVSRADIGFETLHNEVHIVAADGVQHVPRATKREVAGAILDRVEALLGGSTCAEV
jgi:phosphopantothenoylcysteine decarboxylase/phosphopantothenate--cysteine ligase